MGAFGSSAGESWTSERSSRLGCGSMGSSRGSQGFASSWGRCVEEGSLSSSLQHPLSPKLLARPSCLLVTLPRKALKAQLYRIVITVLYYRYGVYRNLFSQ